MMGEGGDSRGWQPLSWHNRQDPQDHAIHTMGGWWWGLQQPTASVSPEMWTTATLWLPSVNVWTRQCPCLSSGAPGSKNKPGVDPITDTRFSFKPGWRAGERTHVSKVSTVILKIPVPLDDPLKHSLKLRRFTTKDGWRLTDPERNNPNKPLNGQKCKVEPLSLCWLLQIF